MEPTKLVLDYASRKARGRVRLPSRSTVRMRPPDPPGAGVEIVEKLEAKGGANLAMAFALLTLLMLAAAAYPNVRRMVVRHRLDEHVVISLVVAALEIGAILAVATNTWRTTVVRAAGRNLHIRLDSGHKVHTFDVYEIADILATESKTLTTDKEPSLAEVTVRLLSGSEVKLFIGHSPPDVRELAFALRRALMFDGSALP